MLKCTFQPSKQPEEISSNCGILPSLASLDGLGSFLLLYYCCAVASRFMPSGRRARRACPERISSAPERPPNNAEWPDYSRYYPKVTGSHWILDDLPTSLACVRVSNGSRVFSVERLKLNEMKDTVFVCCGCRTLQ